MFQEQVLVDIGYLSTKPRFRHLKISLTPNKQEGTHCYETDINNLLKILVLQELQKKIKKPQPPQPSTPSLYSNDKQRVVQTLFTRLSGLFY
jgi:hypothetical protein